MIESQKKQVSMYKEQYTTNWPQISTESQNKVACCKIGVFNTGCSKIHVKSKVETPAKSVLQVEPPQEAWL